jgi:hypothetical protein
MNALSFILFAEEYSINKVLDEKKFFTK